MKIVIRTVFFHFLCILVFAIFYYNFKDHFQHNFKNEDFTLFDYIVFNYVYFAYKKVLYFVYNDSAIKQKTRLDIPIGSDIRYIIYLFTCVAFGIAPCQIVRILLRQ